MGMIKMKRFLSLVLAAVLLFTFCVPVFAASKKCSCNMTPVVYIVGFGDSLYKDLDTDEPSSIFPPDGKAIAKSIPDLLVAVGCLLTGNKKGFGTFASRGANLMLSDLACNIDGTAPANTGIEPMDPIVDTHKFPAFAPEDGMDEGYFKFRYDWRLSPIDNAKFLKNFIDEVKTVTGHSEVVLAAHSQGNTVLTSYLQLYGSKGIEKIICLSPAFQGLSLVGSLFKREIDVSHKGDALEEYLRGIMGFETAQNKLIISVISLINSYGVIDFALNYLQKVLDSELEKVFDECLIDVFGTMPGLWAFVPAEDYEDAKEIMFGDDEKYADIIKKTDYYCNKVQKKTVDILKKAKANGTDIVIAAGYDISTIPVTSAEASHGDLLIDTEYMTLGATCSSITETLGDGYKQAINSCGHNHISPENVIDASTCAFPEYTWFFRGNGHADFGDEYCEFIEWAIRYDGQPTVRISKNYPQFMAESEGKISPATAKEAVDNRRDEDIIVTSLYEMIKDSAIK